MFIVFLAALAAPAPPAPIRAPAPAQAAVDPAAVKEALLLLDEGDFEGEAIRNADLALELGIASMIDQIQKKSGEKVPADFVEKLRQIMRDHTSSTLRAKMGTIKQQAANAYAQEFTRDELARLRELSKDPVLVKARERNKTIGPKLMALGAYTMRESEPELEAKIDRLVSDYLAKQPKGSDHS